LEMQVIPWNSVDTLTALVLAAQEPLLSSQFEEITNSCFEIGKQAALILAEAVLFIGMGNGELPLCFQRPRMRDGYSPYCFHDEDRSVAPQTLQRNIISVEQALGQRSAMENLRVRSYCFSSECTCRILVGTKFFT